MKNFRFFTTMFVLLLVSIWATDMFAQTDSDQFDHNVKTTSNPVKVEPAQNIVFVPIDKSIPDPYVGRYQIGEKSWPIYRGPRGGLYTMMIKYDPQTGQPDPTGDTFKYYIPANSRSKIQFTDNVQLYKRE